MTTTNIQVARKPIDATAEQTEATRLLAALRELAPELAARSQEIEDGRRVPRDIADKLRKMGLFRTLLPRSLGGLELTAPDVVAMLEILAAADASVGWVASIAVTGQIMMSRAPRATLERIYREDPDTMSTGLGAMAGQAEKIDGGYRVSGRWPFASGCQNAQWIAGHCVVYKNGEPVMSDHGPQTRFVLAPADRWRIEETWQASGLAGTGSHHVSLDRVEVPEEYTFDLLNGKSSVPGVFESAVTPFIASVHAAVAVGIATGAMADLVAASDRRLFLAATDLRDSPVFQHQVGRLDAQLRAARALVQVQTEKQWQRALEGTLDAKADLTEGLQANAWVHTACTEVVSGCYTLGGSSSIMNTSPLQRRLRDMHAARQHWFAQERWYEAAGKNALGFPPVDPFFGR